MNAKKYKLTITTLIIGAITLAMAQPAQAAWLSGWSYRKKVTLAGQTGAGTDYQVKLLVGATASASGENFDLEGHSTDFPAATDDGGDLQFTDNDGETTLDFWVEQVSGSGNSALATVWVEVKDSLESNVDIYCYYGKSGATNASSGFNTFDWFDDFADESLNASYTKRNFDGWTESGGVLTFTTSGTTTYDPNVLTIDNKTYGWGYELRSKIQIRQWQDHDYSRMGIGLRTTTTGTGYKGLFHYASGKTRAVLHDLIAWLSQTSYAWSLNTWYNITFFASLSGSTRTLYEKDWATGSAEPGSYSITTTSTNATNQNGQPCIAGCSIPTGGFTTQFIGDYDDVFVRKCLITEPAFSSADSEETQAPAGEGLRLEGIKIERMKFQ